MNKNLSDVPDSVVSAHHRRLAEKAELMRHGWYPGMSARQTRELKAEIQARKDAKK